MKKINKVSYLKNKKQLQELYRLGKQFDKEKDPEKKAVLEKTIVEMCAVLKGKLNLQDCSDEEAKQLLGVPSVADTTTKEN